MCKGKQGYSFKVQDTRLQVRGIETKVKPETTAKTRRRKE